MRRRLSQFVVTAAAIAAAGSASANDLTISTTVGFETRYVFRGVQLADFSAQPAVTVGYKGFYGGAWFNLPVAENTAWVTPGLREMDLNGGYSAELNKFVTVDIGLTYYTYPQLASGFFDVYEEDKSGLGANTLEPYIGFSFSAPLSPSIYFYHDVYLDTTTFQGGVSHSFPLEGKFSLDLSGALGYVIDDTPGTDYLYGSASANVSYPLTDNASFYVGARYGGSDIAGGSLFSDISTGATKSNGFWFGLGFSSSF
ncbi:MAG: hypothetical protein GC153_01530 [Alphaproteobacteria bacterium]|nr:hypothetical protein [Alphaproteobacteria bacterium]